MRAAEADLSADAVPVGRNPAAAWPAVAAVSILSLIVGLHLALVGAGQWEGDEYYNFAQLRALGPFYFWHRLLHWAPRPVSEALVYAYSWVVNTTGSPLIGAFLAILWLSLIGAALAHVSPTRFDLRRLNRARALPRFLLGAAVLASFLLGHTVAEVFYWPMGAAAYLPTLGATVYVTIAIVDGQLESSRGRAAIAIALIIAAASSEVGAMFAAAFVPALLLFDRARRSAANGCGHLPLGWAIAPFAVSVGVIALASIERAGANLALLHDSTTLHHFWPSLKAALAQNGLELFALSPDDTSPAALLSGLVVRVMMFLGFRWCLRRGDFPGVPGAHVAALIVALLIGGFGSLLAGYDLFGFFCCLRHETLRECGYVLVLLALAALGLGRPHTWLFERADWFGPAALVSAALLAFDGRGSALLATYRLYPATIAAREANWANAARPGTELTFTDRHTLLTGQLVWPAGHFTRAAATPWYISSMLGFFRKESVSIVPRSAAGTSTAGVR